MPMKPYELTHSSFWLWGLLFLKPEKLETFKNGVNHSYNAEFYGKCHQLAGLQGRMLRPAYSPKPP